MKTSDSQELLQMGDNGEVPLPLTFTSNADAIAKYRECDFLVEDSRNKKNHYAEASHGKDHDTDHDTDLLRLAKYYECEEADRIAQKNQCLAYLKDQDIVEVTSKEDLDPFWHIKDWKGMIRIATQLPGESDDKYKERKEQVKQGIVFIGDFRYIE